jgi:cell division protein FtsW
MSRLKTKSAWYINLYTLPIILTCIGLYFVYEGSSIRSLNLYQDSFFFVRKQAMWFGLALLAMFIFSRLNYRRLYIIALPVVIVSIVLLVAVLIPGLGSNVNGARRWFNLGPFNIQPAELAKSAIILYLAAWFQHREKQRIIAFVLLLLVIAGLIMLQPDMGTTMIVVLISLGMYFVAGVDLKKFFIVLPAFVLVAIITAQSATYRLHRLLVLFDVNRDPQGIGYHVRQIIIAIQNGGLFGLGFGGSKQKFLFLPEPHTDSIFAIIVEELGFLGALGFISLYALFLYYLYRVVVQMKNRFGFMLGTGIMLFFGFQSLLNLAAMTRLAPLTGVPLPFISYGGTSLLISFCLVGIMINLARQESAPEKPHVLVKAFRAGSVPIKKLNFWKRGKK